MAAVLQAVVDDLRGSAYRHAAGYGASTDSRRRRAAVAYVARRDRAWPFSFENLCDALSLDPGRLRNALEKGPRQGRHASPAESGAGDGPRSIVPLDAKAGDRILCGNSGAEAGSGRPLRVIAEDIEGEALATLTRSRRIRRGRPPVA